MNWIKVKTREVVDKDKELATVIPYMKVETVWDMRLPEDDEMILVSDGKKIWTDIWVVFENGSDFEETDFENYKHLWWSHLPEPPTEVDQ